MGACGSKNVGNSQKTSPSFSSLFGLSCLAQGWGSLPPNSQNMEACLLHSWPFAGPWPASGGMESDNWGLEQICIETLGDLPSHEVFCFWYALSSQKTSWSERFKVSVQKPVAWSMDWNYWVWKSKGQFSHASWSIEQDWVKQQKLENRCLWEGCHWRWATKKTSISRSL